MPRLVPLLALLALTGCPGTRPEIFYDLGSIPGEGGIGFPDSGSATDTVVDTGPLDNSVVTPDKLVPLDLTPWCPNQCVDGDPCTSDSCVQGKCVHAKVGAQVRRYYNTSTGAHAFGPPSSGPAGFSAEGLVFRTLPLAVAGAVKIYQQATSKDYMLSLSASEGVACCGYKNVGDIGHGFSSKQQGTIALYRLYQASTGLHLSSTSSTEGTQLGYKLEGVTVYVCPL